MSAKGKKRAWLGEVEDLAVKEGLTPAEIARRFTGRADAPSYKSLCTWFTQERLAERREAYIRRPRQSAELIDREIADLIEERRQGKVSRGEFADHIVKLQAAKSKLYKPVHRRAVALEVWQIVLDISARKGGETLDALLTVKDDVRDALRRYAEED